MSSCGAQKRLHYPTRQGDRVEINCPLICGSRIFGHRSRVLFAVFSFFPASLWDATGSPDFWKVWSLLILAVLSLLVLVGTSRLTGIVHLVFSSGFLALLYFSLSSHTISSPFGSLQMPALGALFAT